MPGYASWKQLYIEEYKALYEEGYDVGEDPKTNGQAFLLPLPEDMKTDAASFSADEAAWKAAYNLLWQQREKGLRTGYSYVEPVMLDDILSAGMPMKALTPLDKKYYEDRIRGGWFGRCGAVILGKPLEMGYNRREIMNYLQSLDAYPLTDYVPASSPALGITLREDCIPSTLGNVHYVQADDDIHYTILALLLTEKKGLEFTPADVGRNWLDNIPYHWFWCASRQCYYHMVNLDNERSVDEQVAEFPWKINPWRECIDGQLRGDFWGYVNPGNPQKAAELAWRECSFSLVKNGIYGGMFVAGCIAVALSRDPTIDSILDAGMSVIPRECRLAETVRQVRAWYLETPDWIAVCDNIAERWGHLPFSGTENNMAMVVLSLLHGALDFEKTITTAVMCGIDTDCNSATAGSIVGVAIGYHMLPEKWIAPLNNTVKSVVASFGEGTIEELVQRTLMLIK